MCFGESRLPIEGWNRAAQGAVVPSYHMVKSQKAAPQTRNSLDGTSLGFGTALIARVEILPLSHRAKTLCAGSFLCRITQSGLLHVAVGVLLQGNEIEAEAQAQSDSL